MINKILLISPPIEDFYQTKIRQEPLGLEYLAAILHGEGYDVQIVDALEHKSTKTIPLPDQLSYLKKFYPSDDISPFKLFTRYQHFGLDVEKILNQLKKLKPDLIGISVNFTPYYGSALKITQLCKHTLPKAIIVMGGHHATAMPKRILQSGFVDYVVLGEGEFTFLKLIEILNRHEIDKLKSLAGIAFKDRRQIKINPSCDFIEDLDSLPFPILSHTTKTKMIVTSRGCPRGCNFCSIEKVMGKKIRIRSIASIIEEINLAVAQGIKHIDFEDDNLTCDKSRAVDLFQALIKSFRNAGIKLSAMNGLNTETLDVELIKLMKEAGFEWLNLPLVSGNYEVQRSIHRHQSKENFLEIVNLANKYRLKVVAYLILGLPEDRLEQILQDIIFLAGQQVLLGPSIFYPPPGTQTYLNCLSRGYIEKDDYLRLRSSAIPVETDYFTRTDLVTLFRLVRVVNYLKHLVDQYLTKDENFYQYIPNPNKLKNDHKLSSLDIGHLLLYELFIKGELKGIRLKNRMNDNYHYESLKYHHSPNLVLKFLDLLKGQRIPGVKNKREFLF